jgi:hypothetical protein
VNREGEEESIRLMYFIYLHKNRTMKFVEIILSMEYEGARE